jgi:hypothetical protein
MPKLDAVIAPGLKRAFRALPALQRLARFGLDTFVEVTMGSPTR